MSGPGPLPVQPPPGWPRWAVAAVSHCLAILIAAVLAVVAIGFSIYFVIFVSSFLRSHG